MLAFCWYSQRPLPASLDLARSGWSRFDAPGPPGEPQPAACAIIVDQAGLDAAQRVMLWSAPAATRGRMLLAGVAHSAQRARLLAAGFGDALALPAVRDEVEQRALRLLRRPAQAMLLRRAGPLLLDLAAQEARLAGRRVPLHPREFALLWALADRPGAALGKPMLLREVCHLGHDPGTNRIAVHVSRLRAKLAAAGVHGLVETTAHGAYRLVRTPTANEEVAGPPGAIGQTAGERWMTRWP